MCDSRCNIRHPEVLNQMKAIPTLSTISRLLRPYPFSPPLPLFYFLFFFDTTLKAKRCGATSVCPHHPQGFLLLFLLRLLCERFALWAYDAKPTVFFVGVAVQFVFFFFEDRHFFIRPAPAPTPPWSHENPASCVFLLSKHYCSRVRVFLTVKDCCLVIYSLFCKIRVTPFTREHFLLCTHGNLASSHRSFVMHFIVQGSPYFF